MQMHAPEAGLASLLASRGRNGDSVLVHMAPEELQGLQSLAMAHGGELTINPETGLYEASFLKSFLPMIAGAVLNTFAPGVGSAVGRALGFGAASAGAAGTALLVGGATGLIEGDLKKGLMAGLGAYSGANIAQSLQASAAAAPKVSADVAAKNAQDITAAREAAKQTVGATAEATNLPKTFIDQYSGATPAVAAPTVAAPNIADLKPVEIMSKGVGTPTAQDLIQGRLMNQGISPGQSLMTGAGNLFTSPESRSAFGQALGGGFESPFAQNAAKYATYMGLANAFTPEPKAMPTSNGEDYMYIPGAMNPKYGTGALEPFYLPGRYYKKTPQGLVPYNPYQMAPGVRGFAYGGMVSPSDQNMNQPRQIPDQSRVMPYPNQNYPLSTVVQSNYASQPINRPQAQEVVDGYEPKINPFTGEEKFAEGGAVDALGRPLDPTSIEAQRAYIANIQNRAMNPVYNPYGTLMTQNAAGAVAPRPYTPNPATYDDGTGTGAAGGVDPLTGLAASYGMYKGLQALTPYAQQLAAKMGIGTAGAGAGAADAGAGTFGGTAATSTVPAGAGTFGGTYGAGTAGTAPAGGAGAGASAGAATPYYLQGGSGIEAAGLQGLTAEQLAQLPAGAGIDTLMKAGFDTGALTPGLSALTPQQLVQLPENELMKMGLDPKVVQSIKADSLAGKVIPGAQTALGLYTMYKGIEQGKAGQAALGGYGAGAGIASLAGSNLAPILGMNPIGLGLAALAAIGSTLVQKNEFGEVALRNYWRGVDQGRSIGQSDPTELAQGFINFYRTNKNDFPGQAKYGRTGNEDFMYDMTQVINNAVQKGEVPKDATPDVILKQVVQPWLDTMGPGPQHPDARRVQNYMMTDLINSFMQGKPISNAQVKGDSKFKIVSEKPTYLGVPPKPAEPAAVQTGIPEARNPYGYGEQTFADGGEIGTNEVNFGFAGGGDTEYLAGGKLLDGPGDGMSDDIPAVIRGKRVQRAALADGEFVVPADVVSHLGNGSTKAGAKKLYAMMDRLREARTGRTRQAPAVNADRMLPA